MTSETDTAVEALANELFIAFSGLNLPPDAMSAPGWFNVARHVLAREHTSQSQKVNARQEKG